MPRRVLPEQRHVPVRRARTAIRHADRRLLRARARVTRARPVHVPVREHHAAAAGRPVATLPGHVLRGAGRGRAARRPRAGPRAAGRRDGHDGDLRVREGVVLPAVLVARRQLRHAGRGVGQRRPGGLLFGAGRRHGNRSPGRHRAASGRHAVRHQPSRPDVMRPNRGNEGPVQERTAVRAKWTVNPRGYL